MRFKLTLNRTTKQRMLPMDYQYYVSAWIYKVLKQADKEFAHFLHEKGYGRQGESKLYKLFCFSRLNFGKPRLWKEKKLFEIREHEIDLQISFDVPEAAANFIKGLFMSQEFYLGDKFNGIDFKVSKVEALPEPEFSETMQYRLQTPWVVSYILDGWKLSLTGLRAPSGIKLKTNNMQKFEPLTYGNYFHIYNRGINSCNIFAENENYEYFLHLYDEKISPVADTYAWALMPNHFHFLVRIKLKEEIPEVINILNPDGALSPVRVGTPAKQFSKFFNSYAQAINKRYHRHGGLFERPFKRKRIDNLLWLKRVILYIHNNPVHHGFCNHPLEYPWTSYLSCISVKPTKLQREKVIGWFDEKANFVTRHNERLDITEIEDFLGVYETRELPKTDEDDIMNLNPDGASSPVKAGKNKKPEK